ncbi:glycosyl transferase [Paenibacillus darwinianus]|uniref:Glycosyl transferase n=1 Tax=Paenibacillus darwinianus TaxID=1380763 RepID=A0A9W5S3V3_9BACL|nr:flagellar brake domain-containing protein [Paenibacillus darwinianus]EXX91392.1 glycosyl transferase [Paenibacillus darwinianus]EXX92224.1 glycosyl transferase [Paenibacillus darwinianus]EXX92335.1 glycosyl transferase [Paenibacillus darwinianus]
MLPKVNQTLFLQVASSDEEEAGVDYKSRIADMDDDRMMIEIPINERTGRYKKLYLGDELSAFFITDGGVKNFFSTHVLGFKDEAIRLIAVEKPDPESITQMQRRSFLRVSAELELAVKLNDHVRFLALTDDVGGGGISFIAEGKWKLKPEDILECWLALPYKNGSIEHASFRMEIVRVKPLIMGRDQIMAKFNAITDGERQKIIRYCFERQLQFRKN